LQLYQRAEQIAIDKVGWLPLFYPKFNILLNPRVEGLEITPNGLVAPDWAKVRLK
jgi:ABC-type transport system substrate-binding protein